MREPKQKRLFTSECDGGGGLQSLRLQGRVSRRFFNSTIPVPADYNDQDDNAPATLKMYELYPAL